MNKIIGFLGFGEAAFNISLGLGKEGAQGILAFDAMQSDPVMGQLVKKRVEESCVTLLDDPVAVARKADILFTAVPSSNTLDLCKTIAGCLHENQLYVDVSASTPELKKAIWKIIQPTGALFADAAMLGSLPKDKHKVPILASGNGAKSFHDLMVPYHMQITCIGDEPGAASAIKLVRSIFMKGIAALMVEMLQASDAYSVSDEVIKSISESLDGIPFESHLNRLVTGTAIHAKRRGKELIGSEQMLCECGVDSVMTVAARKKHEMLAEMNFAEQYVASQPSGWQEIIDKLGKAKAKG